MRKKSEVLYSRVLALEGPLHILSIFLSKSITEVCSSQRETTHNPGLTRAPGTCTGTCASLSPGHTDAPHVTKPSFRVTTRPCKCLTFLSLSVNSSLKAILGELPGSGMEFFKAPDQKAPGRAPAGLSQCQEETWCQRLANAQIDHE